jgi:hypothetical protein
MNLNIIHYRDFLADPRGTEAAKELLGECKCEPQLKCRKCVFGESDEKGKCKQALGFVQEAHCLHGLSADIVSYQRTAETVHFALKMQTSQDGLKKFKVSSTSKVTIYQGSNYEVKARSLVIDFLPFVGQTLFGTGHVSFSCDELMHVSYEPVFLVENYRSKLDRWESPFFTTFTVDGAEHIVTWNSGLFTMNLVNECVRHFTSQNVIGDQSVRKIVLCAASKKIDDTNDRNPQYRTARLLHGLFAFHQLNKEEKLLKLVEQLAEYFRESEAALKNFSGLPPDIIKHGIVKYL